MFHLDEQAILDLEWGAAFLGAGGGGDTTLTTRAAVHTVRAAAPVPVLAPHELDDEALVIPVAAMGTPLAMEEKVPGRTALRGALERLERRLGRRADALVPCEVGGLNAPYAVASAAVSGLPLVDADGFGRALPELQMLSFSIYGVRGCPCVLVNERGDAVTVDALDDPTLEHLARGIVHRFGGRAHVAGFAMTGRRLKETGVLLTLSFARRLGEAARLAGRDLGAVIAAIQEASGNSTYGPAVVLAQGMVTAVDRQTTSGPMAGGVLIRSVRGPLLQLHFQNEFLLAEQDTQPVAMVPDIISVLDTESLQPVPADQLAYGQEVAVLALPAPALMRTRRALRRVGPRCFGYDVDYRPLPQAAPAAGEEGEDGPLRPGH